MAPLPIFVAFIHSDPGLYAEAQRALGDDPQLLLWDAALAHTDLRTLLRLVRIDTLVVGCALALLHDAELQGLLAQLPLAPHIVLLSQALDGRAQLPAGLPVARWLRGRRWHRELPITLRRLGHAAARA